MKKKIIILIIIGLLCSYNMTFGDLFKYKDDEGIDHLTNDPERCKIYGCKRILKEKRILSPVIDSSRQPDSRIWEYLGTNDTGDHFYNKTNITRSSNGLSVWVYNTVEGDKKKKFVEGMKRISVEKYQQYQNYNSSMNLFDFDCSKRLFKLRENINYDDKMNLIEHRENIKSKWIRIPFNTPVGILYDKFCVIQTEQTRKK